VAVEHFPLPLLSRIRLGRHRQRAMGVIPCSRMGLEVDLAGPLSQVGLEANGIKLNNSNEIQTSEICRKFNKFYKNMKPHMIFELKYIL
jgi:hypothetical protein